MQLSSAFALCKRYLYMTCFELIAQNQSVTNWLTPLWLLSVGISIGFLLVLVALIKIWFGSKLPVFSSVGDGASWTVAGTVLSLIYVAAAIAFFLWARYRFDTELFVGKDIGLFLGFAIPLSFLLGFGVWKLMTPRGSEEVFSLWREGFLFWLNMICVAMVVFALAGYGLAVSGGMGIIKFVDEPYVLLNSATRLPVTGPAKIEVEVPPTESKIGGTKIDVDLYGEEVQFVTARTDQPLEIATEPISTQLGPHRLYSLDADASPRLFVRRQDGNGRIPNGKIDGMYVVNLGNAPAKLEFGYLTQPVHPEVWIIPWAAFTVLMVYLTYLVAASAFPKIFAVAYSTFKTEVNQPLFTFIAIIGLVFILGSVYVPYNTFGEDIKMYKDSGLTLIRVLAIFLAVWAASKSVAEEIDGRTALTVLSKPIGRRQFIFGKFSGIGLLIGLLFILLGLWLVGWTAYKPIYDGKESSQGLIDWQVAFNHAMGMIPALFLSFLEVLIFVAVSIAISTRMGILANFLLCFSIYVLGHLTPLIVQSSVGEFEIVQVFGSLIAIVFPVLNHFDVQAAINTNQPVPMTYLGWAVIYSGLYSTIAMLIALVLFEDRDLA